MGKRKNDIVKEFSIEQDRDDINVVINSRVRVYADRSLPPEVEYRESVYTIRQILNSAMNEDSNEYANSNEILITIANDPSLLETLLKISLEMEDFAGHQVMIIGAINHGIIPIESIIALDATYDNSFRSHSHAYLITLVSEETTDENIRLQISNHLAEFSAPFQSSQESESNRPRDNTFTESDDQNINPYYYVTTERWVDVPMRLTPGYIADNSQQNEPQRPRQTIYINDERDAEITEIYIPESTNDSYTINPMRLANCTDDIPTTTQRKNSIRSIIKSANCLLSKLFLTIDDTPCETEQPQAAPSISLANTVDIAEFSMLNPGGSFLGGQGML